MKRLRALLCALLITALMPLPVLGESEENVIEPAVPVSESVQWLLEIASGEVGYTEGAHGYTKYGEWSGDAYAQWCAEFLCWCVNQVDELHGTQLLNTQWPNYSGSNTGRSWFIRQGRYIVHNGYMEGWGIQWLKGSRQRISPGDYIPQPGDWVFFTWTETEDTDHVAMVEYCTREADGSVNIHVIEGNAPNAVQRTVYPLTYSRILGFGTVSDLADITMRSGCSGEKVSQLQEKLRYLGYLDGSGQDGTYGGNTTAAVRQFQKDNGLTVNGIANMETQLLLDDRCQTVRAREPGQWVVEDEE